jgi:uncharacterized protein with PQ loop repeat
MDVSLPVIAGAISTTIFALSTLPMLKKAVRTKDLSSYSLGSILLSNAGNAVHSIYIFHLPPGPIWLLHGFYLITTGLMLIWYMRYEWQPRQGTQREPSGESGRRPIILLRRSLLDPVPRPDTPLGA